MEVPDMLQQHGAGYHAAFVTRQILQKLKLSRQESDVLAAAAGAARHQVNREIAHAQDGLFDNGITASAKRLDTRQQFDEGKRFDQIIIAPGSQAAYPIVDL